MKDEKQTQRTYSDEIKEYFSSLDKEKINFFARRLLWFAISFIFGRGCLIFDTYPLGLAFFCSVRRLPLYSFSGLFLSALFIEQKPYYLIGYLVAALYRIIIIIFSGKENSSPAFFADSVFTRLAASALGALTTAVFSIIGHGFLYYDLIGGIFLIICSMVMTFVFSLAFDDNEKYSGRYETGIAAILFAITVSLGSASFVGFSLKHTVAFIFTLYCAKQGGAMRGGIIGFLCGLAIGVTAAPVFCIVGFISGILFPIKTYIAVCVSLILGVISSLYIDGYTALADYLPEATLAFALFLLCDALKILPSVHIFKQEGKAVPAISTLGVITEQKQLCCEEKLEEITLAMQSVSSMFYSLSDKQKSLSYSEIEAICDEIFSNFCDGCTNFSQCCNKDNTAFYKVKSKISSKLSIGENASISDFPDFMRNRCRNCGKIISDINLKMSKTIENKLKSDKIEVLALDYELLSDIIKDAMRENSAEHTEDVVLSEKLRKNMRYNNLSANNVCAYGKRRKSIIVGGIEESKVKYISKEIQSNFEAITARKLSSPKYNILNNYIIMQLSSVPIYRCEYYSSQSSKLDEGTNGDTVCSFISSEDYFYSIISDGMGSGNIAGNTSSLCTVFLEKMLKAGNSIKTSLKLLNHFIMQKNGECFSTVDLLEVDLLTGIAKFIKNGSAPSFVIRNGNIFQIESHTLPVGILNEIKAEETEFKLKKDDIIIMVSDGIAEASENTIWLYNIFTYDIDNKIEDIAAKIISEAEKMGARSDDLSVNIVKLEKIKFKKQA